MTKVGKKERTFALNTAQRKKSTCLASLSPPGTPLGFGRLCNFLATIFFFIFTRFLFVTCFPSFFFGQRPRSQIAAVASQRHKRAAQEKGGEREREEKIKSEYVEQVQTIVQAAGCRLKVPCRLSSFCFIPFRFVSFRFVSHSWHPMALQFLLQCKNVFATSEIERQLADAPSCLFSMCGRGPHCSLPVAFYCLLLGVN